jgi:hypothetical protein
MRTPNQSLPRKKRDHPKTTRITTTLYELVKAISEETTAQEENLVYLAVDNLIRTGRLKRLVD